MANSYKGGFRWARSKSGPGQGVNPPVNILPVATAYGTVIYRGGAVKLLSDGTIAAAAAGDTIYGIADGAAQYFDGTVVRSGGKLPVSSWGTNISRQSLLRVIPVRDQIFLAAGDDATTGTTLAAYQAFVGENVEWVAGTAVGDESGDLLDISTHATTNTLSVRIEGISNPQLTDFTSTGVTLEVSFNLIQDTGSGSTTGT
jgi:hypothetical protein